MYIEICAVRIDFFNFVKLYDHAVNKKCLLKKLLLDQVVSKLGRPGE